MDKEQNNAQSLRAKDVAMYLGIGLSTVWLYAKQGKITPYRLSERVTVFRKEDIDEVFFGGLQ